MKEDRRDTRKETVVRSDADRNKEETRMAHCENPSSMPNPVKGLTLSLYPMNKEH
jgi:hypothetical protein